MEFWEGGVVLNIMPIRRRYGHLFTCPAITGHLCCFQPGAIRNRGAMSIVVHIFLITIIFRCVCVHPPTRMLLCVYLGVGHMVI